MDKQTIFNKVLAGIRAQGRLGESLYQSREDPSLKCAIGMLIEPNLYSKDLEYQDPINVLLAIGYFKDKHYSHNMPLFLQAIQNNHDCANDLQSFEIKMQGLAIAYGLNYE